MRVNEIRYGRYAVITVSSVFNYLLHVTPSYLLQVVTWNGDSANTYDSLRMRMSACEHLITIN